MGFSNQQSQKSSQAKNASHFTLPKTQQTPLHRNRTLAILAITTIGGIQNIVSAIYQRAVRVVSLTPHCRGHLTAARLSAPKFRR